MRLSAWDFVRVAAVTGLLAPSIPAPAQTTGEMLASVSDPTGVPLPGVSVEIRSPALQGIRIAASDERGLVRFSLLPPGIYAAGASLSSLASDERKGIRVALGEVTTVPLQLSLATAGAAQVLSLIHISEPTRPY